MEKTNTKIEVEANRLSKDIALELKAILRYYYGDKDHSGSIKSIMGMFSMVKLSEKIDGNAYNAVKESIIMNRMNSTIGVTMGMRNLIVSETTEKDGVVRIDNTVIVVKPVK